MTITSEQVTHALRSVVDPELGLSIVDLGLIYDVQIDGGRVAITMTLTTQSCPLHDAMAEWIRRAVGQIHGMEEVSVAITFEPPWSPERIALGANAGVASVGPPRAAAEAESG